MPNKKNEKMEIDMMKNKKYFFLIVAIFAFSLIILVAPLISTKYSLSCFEDEGKIVCNWKGCALKDAPEKSELVIAKSPGYVETVNIEERTGSAFFSPSPFAGTYTILLSCANGDRIIPKLTVG